MSYIYVCIATVLNYMKFIDTYLLLHKFKCLIMLLEFYSKILMLHHL